MTDLQPSTSIDYEARPVPGRSVPPVDCLLWRDSDGIVRGTLNHYRSDYLGSTGFINVAVDPRWRRRGIATALIREATWRWGPFAVDRQTYTPEGARLTQELQRRGAVPWL